MATDVRSVSMPAPTVAPRAGLWRRIAGDAAWVSGSTLVGQAFGAVTSLLLRVLLDPAQIGLWQAVRLLINYGNLSNLGVSRGATREMTIALGRGDEPAAQHAANLAFTVNTLASLVFGLALIAAGGATALARPQAIGWGAALAVAGALCIVQRYLTYQVTILRARQAFALTAHVTVVEAALTLAVCGAMTAAFGLGGLYVGSLLVGGLTIAFTIRRATFRVGWAWDSPAMRRLLAIGLPIMLAALATQLFRSLDRLTILLLFPDCAAQLGIYSVALLVTGQLFGLANALATVMGPRYGEALGRHGTPESVASLAALASGPQTALLALIGSGAMVLGAPLLALILPDYRAGLPCLAWLVPGTIALGIALPASQYLITVDRQRTLLRIVVICTVLATVGNLVAVVLGAGLIGLAASTSVAQMLYALTTVAISFWPQLDARQRRRYLVQVIVPAAPCLTLAAVLARWPAVDNAWLAVLVHGAIVAAAWGASAWIAWRIDVRLCAASRREITSLGEAAKSAPRSLAEWRERCYKPGAHHLGNAYARHVIRPLALQVTRWLGPWGVSAHVVTLLALAVAATAAAAMAWGSPGALLVAAALLQFWYLLDHVDGQLARYHARASLDGVQLDYLMHHLVHVLLPLGWGWGAFRATDQAAWMLVGVVAAIGLLFGGLRHDARYKAFVQRLKWVDGELIVVGGGGFRPEPEPRLPRRIVPGFVFVARKTCQLHVTMNVLAVLALVGWLTSDDRLLLARGQLTVLAVLAAGLTAFDVARGIRRGEAESEFARWYRLPPATRFTQQNGRWRVDDAAAYGEASHPPHTTADSPAAMTLFAKRAAR